MAGMAAGEMSDPCSRIILLEPDDRALHTDDYFIANALPRMGSHEAGAGGRANIRIEETGN